MLLELSLLDEPLRRQLSEEPVLEIVEVAVSTTPESSDARESAQGELAENSATPAGGAGAAARALGPHRAGNLGIWPGPAGLRRSARAFGVRRRARRAVWTGGPGRGAHAAVRG